MQSELEAEESAKSVGPAQDTGGSTPTRNTIVEPSARNAVRESPVSNEPEDLRGPEEIVSRHRERAPVRVAYVPYPPTSFPYRDLLVLEQLGLEPTHRVCEIGVGSGETTARLARVCAEVTGFEISRATVQALSYLERRHANLRLVAADITDLGAFSSYAGQFERAVSCDTLEHVLEPTGFFRGVSALLAPGGELGVTFPNEPRDLMHGVTRFDSPAELIRHARDAGLVDVRLGAARLSPHAARVAERMGWKPLSLARRVVALGRRPSARRGEQPRGVEAAPPPQVFEDTRFFRAMKMWRRLSPAVNLYWYGVLRRMAAHGPAFTIDWDFRETAFEHCQVFITGRKPAVRGAAPPRVTFPS